MTMRAPAALALLVGLAGCATVDHAVDAASPIAEAGVDLARQGYRAAHSAATGPHLTPVSNPAAIAGAAPVVMPMPAPMQMQQVSAPNSLWQAGARTFFNDQRATRVGDILTVKVAIDDKAELDNSTNRTRGGSTDVGVSNFFGQEQLLSSVLGGAFDPSAMIGAEGSSQANNTGAISRQEKIELTLAATISQVLPNGNLVVVGKQEVRINGELRELTVAGIVRPEDVSADNAIRHDQMAEARISYGGRGSLSAVQKPRWGQRVADAISPW